jgi:hypothetical protein
VRQLCELVSVTYGEFQSWYNYGELRLTAERVIHLEQMEDGIADVKSPHVALLMERLPQLSLEDEEGLLIVQLAPSSGERQAADLSFGVDRRVICLSVSRIRRVFPLTERSRRILEPRLSALGVNLEAPHFQEKVRLAWFERGVRRALRGGDALAGVYFEEWSSEISMELRFSINSGIWLLDHKDDPLTEEISELDILGRTWVSDAFSFTRYKPYKKNNGAFDYLLDAGVVLKNCAERQQQGDGFLEQFRNVAKNDLAKNFSSRARMPEVFADVSFIQISKETQEGFPEAFPASLGTLVAFLYWKDLFHKDGEQIDVDRLTKDVPEFLSAIGFEATVAAVWLLGCFAGYERVVPAVYAADAHAYPWYSGTPLYIEKISRPVAEEPVESELAVHGVSAAKVEGAEASEPTTKAEVGHEDAREPSALMDSPEATSHEESNTTEKPTEDAQEASDLSERTYAVVTGAENASSDHEPPETESESMSRSIDQPGMQCESAESGNDVESDPQKSLDLFSGADGPKGGRCCCL